jgi:DNA polymerase III epsilon subunit-like protein
MILAFDTETTGKADFKKPASHPSQPRLVQLGAILYDKNFEVRAEANLIVKPDGFEIPKSVSDIHGITTEIANEYGMNERAVLMLFHGMMRKASVLVAHNIEFDTLIMGRAYAAQKIDPPVEPNRIFCTMQAMTPICKIKGPYGFKWPNLQEAHQFCFNTQFEDAHDAMADVRACAKIYNWLWEMKFASPEDQAKRKEILKRLEAGGNDGADVDEAEQFWEHINAKYGLTNMPV